MASWYSWQGPLNDYYQPYYSSFVEPFAEQEEQSIAEAVQYGQGSLNGQFLPYYNSFSEPLAEPEEPSIAEAVHYMYPPPEGFYQQEQEQEPEEDSETKDLLMQFIQIQTESMKSMHEFMARTDAELADLRSATANLQQQIGTVANHLVQLTELEDVAEEQEEEDATEDETEQPARAEDMKTDSVTNDESWDVYNSWLNEHNMWEPEPEQEMDTTEERRESDLAVAPRLKSDRDRTATSQIGEQKVSRGPVAVPWDRVETAAFQNQPSSGLQGEEKEPEPTFSFLPPKAPLLLCQLNQSPPPITWKELLSHLYDEFLGKCNSLTAVIDASLSGAQEDEDPIQDTSRMHHFCIDPG